MIRRAWGAALGLVALLAAPATRAIEVGPVDVHGCLSQGFIRSQKNQYIAGSRKGTFDFREYALNVSARPWDRLHLGAQVFGREYGEVGNDKTLLHWLQADYLLRDWLGIRAGKLRVPYGLYGETRDIDGLRTTVLLPQGVYMEYMREAFDSGWAAEVHGHVSCGPLGSASYSAQGGIRSRSPENGDMARLFAEQGLGIDGFDERGACAASLTWHAPVDGLRLRATISWDEYGIVGKAATPYGPVPYAADVRDDLLGVGSAEYAWGALLLAAEYMSTGYESEFDYAGPGVPDMSMSGEVRGTYAQGGYQLTSWLAVVAGYSYCSALQNITLRDLPGGDLRQAKEQDQKDGFLSVRLDIHDTVVLKAEQHLASGGAGLFDHDNPGGTTDDWSLTLVKISILF